MKILLATHNKNKMREFRMILADALAGACEIEVLTSDEAGITEEPVEDGTTFAANALIKADFGSRSGYIAVADDSGLSVDALGGAPGVYSARYAQMAGREKGDASNNAYLMEQLQNIPKDKRTAHYVASIACVFPDGYVLTAEDRCDGILLTEPRGNGGFGYDPYFYFPGKGKTFAELTAEEKNEVSHRGKALRKFAAEFVKVWKDHYVKQ